MTSEYAKFLDPVDVESLPIIYFVLPCYNEVEGLEHTAEVLHQKSKSVGCSIENQ